MATILENGDIKFGDGTTQATKTPTNVSAFSNDSSWTTVSAVAGIYATRTNAAYSISCGASRRLNLYYYSGTGAYMGEQHFNCNCNC